VQAGVPERLRLPGQQDAVGWSKLNMTT
jgi:hypothetical protein